MAVTSLVFGILSIILPFKSVGILGFLGFVFGILAIIFGAKTMKEEMTHELGTAGFVCGIIGTVLSLGALFLWAPLWGFFFWPFWL